MSNELTVADTMQPTYISHVFPAHRGWRRTLRILQNSCRLPPHLAHAECHRMERRRRRRLLRRRTHYIPLRRHPRLHRDNVQYGPLRRTTPRRRRISPSNDRLLHRWFLLHGRRAVRLFPCHGIYRVLHRHPSWWPHGSNSYYHGYLLPHQYLLRAYIRLHPTLGYGRDTRHCRLHVDAHYYEDKLELYR